MDDGAGVGIAMEAARIIAQLGIHPKRTIRFALFAGEEQWGVGSQAYVARYIASRPIDARTDLNALQKFVGQPHSWPIRRSIECF
jgi:carboxypeptidase Q